jgi:hypothetical protein
MNDLSLTFDLKGPLESIKSLVNRLVAEIRWEASFSGLPFEAEEALQLVGRRDFSGPQGTIKDLRREREWNYMF